MFRKPKILVSLGKRRGKTPVNIFQILTEFWTMLKVAESYPKVEEFSLLVVSFTLVSCLAYSSTRRWRRTDYMAPYAVILLLGFLEWGETESTWY
jgi:hypothetical protein